MIKRSLLVFLMLIGAAFGAVSVDSGEVFFTLEYPDAADVFLTGDFNGWSETANPMMKEGEVWTVVLVLDNGRYEYKFLVDGIYIEDLDNPEKSADPYGSYNSVVVVGEPVESKSALVPAKLSNAKGVKLGYYNPSARFVFVSGSFNDWSADATPMNSDGDGNWSAKLDLDTGKHEYKLVVDGSWQTDPENPNTASDSYGGVNSVIEVDENGDIVEGEPKAAAERRSNTFANSRVYIGGRYTAIAVSVWDRHVDRRLKLEKPRHRMEAYLRVEISDDVTAWGSLNFDTHDADRIFETALSLDSAAISLSAQDFDGQVYYNRPVGGIGDPMKIFGQSNIAGAPEEKTPFGLGTGGIKASGNILGFELSGLFCDRFESHSAAVPEGALLDDLGRLRYGLFREDVISPAPDPSLYTEFGTDIFGFRASKRIGPIGFGGVLRRDAGTFWSSLSELSIPALDEWIVSTGSTSDWFALGNSEWLYGGYISTGIGAASLWGEYLGYSYYGGVVAGNKENDARDNNGPVDLDLGKTFGHMGAAGLTIEPSEKIEFELGYYSQFINAPDDSGEYFQPAPSGDGDGHIDISVVSINPEMQPTRWESFFVEADVDWPIALWARGGVEKVRDNLSDVDRDLTRFGAGARGTVLWELLGFDFFSDWAFAKTPDGMKQREFLSKFGVRVHLSDQWFINLDAAYHKIFIEAEPGSEIEDDALPVFASIEFMPIENVRMELFWGVHPIMANGWRAGRREFIDNYMMEEEASFAEAWSALEDVRQIGVRGQIDF